MHQPVIFSVTEIRPDEADVLLAQGIKPGNSISERIRDVLDSSMDVFTDHAQPRALLQGLSTRDCQKLMARNRRFERDIPLYSMVPRARRLALFAFTLGEGISHTISRLFRDNDFARGAMLDAVASAAVEKAIAITEAHFNERCKAGTSEHTLLYSPGYCGWHISAQQDLFQLLKPREIGITLNASYLMSPLKSASGVLVAGPAHIHYFDNRYPFCSVCRNPTCRIRIDSIQKQHGGKHGNTKSDRNITGARR